MAHSVTWSAAFDATPAGSDDIKDGDDRIRELKTAVSERMALEHYFTKAGTNPWHGVHTPPYTTKSGNYTLAITDEIVVVTATATITVPAYTSFPTGKRFVIKRVGAGTITIARSGADTFDGATSLSITTSYDWWEIVCTGTAAWYVVGRSYGTLYTAVSSYFTITTEAHWTGTGAEVGKDSSGIAIMRGYITAGAGALSIIGELPANHIPAAAVSALAYWRPSNYRTYPLYISTGTGTLSTSATPEDGDIVFLQSTSPFLVT